MVNKIESIVNKIQLLFLCEFSAFIEIYACFVCCCAVFALFGEVFL